MLLGSCPRPWATAPVDIRTMWGYCPWFIHNQYSIGCDSRTSSLRSIVVNSITIADVRLKLHARELSFEGATASGGERTTSQSLHGCMTGVNCVGFICCDVDDMSDADN